MLLLLAVVVAVPVTSVVVVAQAVIGPAFRVKTLEVALPPKLL
jgi:hypothetical protein